MATREVIALNETTPQLLAPQAGDTYLMPRELSIALSAITTDRKILDLSATWNAAGVTFGGIKLNVTDTASAAASLLMDLQVGGVSKAVITKTGKIGAGYGYVFGSPQFYDASFGEGAGLQIKDLGSCTIYGNANAIIGFSDGVNGVRIDGLRSIGFVNGHAIAASPDVRLWRDAAATLALRDGVNAHTLRLYNTFTDASNYQRLEMGWNTSTALVMNTGAGTGADGSVAFNDAALATTTTKGFVMIPSCAGAPTGVPADIPTGQIPLVFDSTNNKLYAYDGAWLSTAALT